MDSVCDSVAELERKVGAEVGRRVSIRHRLGRRARILQFPRPTSEDPVVVVFWVGARVFSFLSTSCLSCSGGLAEWMGG